MASILLCTVCLLGITLFDVATLDLNAALKELVPRVSESDIRSAIQEVGKSLNRAKITMHYIIEFHGNTCSPRLKIK